jgi:hypothetical protein
LPPLAYWEARNIRVRIGPLRITWLLTVVLAAFVIFVHCIAEVGGLDDPVRQPNQAAPTVSATPSATPVP